MNGAHYWLSLPSPEGARVVHCKQHKADVYIGRGSPYGNPFAMRNEEDRGRVIADFRQWLPQQPELLRLVRQTLIGRSVGCFCAPRPCHGDVYREITEGLWDHLIAEEPVFVYGSNLAGRNGSGAALGAKCQYGARTGVGRGITGHAYALPTKDANLNTLPIGAVLDELDRFIEHALRTPDIQYRMTRVGCTRAGLPEEVIRDHLLERVPANVLLPGTWERMRDPQLARVVVAGSQEFQDYELLARKLDALLGRLSRVEIVSGGTRGAYTLGERYAVERGLRFRRIPAYWDAFGNSAGNVRNRRMSWYATHLAAFWNGTSSETRNMIEIAREDGLGVRVVQAA